MFTRRLFALLLALVSPFILLWLVLEAAGTFRPAAAPIGFFALMGNPTEIAFITDPFINDSKIKLLRSYPPSFLAEAPSRYFPPPLPEDFAIQLFQVIAPNNRSEIRPQIAAALANTGVLVQMNGEQDDLSWLSFLPAELILSGPATEIEALVLSSGVIPTITHLATVPLSGEEQLRLYQISGTQVISAIMLLDGLNPAVAIEPNYMVVGAPDEGHITGSPGGPQISTTVPIPNLGTQPFTGRDVLITLFDTSPIALAPGSNATLYFQNTAVRLSYPFTLPTNLPSSHRWVPGHGTVVASQAVALAPDSNYHLVKVLNETAIGGAFTFYQAVQQAVDTTLALTHTLQGAIFNYSLVIETPYPPDSPTATLRTEAINKIFNWVGAQGIVQIAAAGNNSAFWPIPQELAYPGRNPSVIGVTAAAWNNTIACYANQGEIAIWGGGLARGQTCQVETMPNLCSQDPTLCMIGWDPTVATNRDWGFGTSFATPLVAGFAAQIVEFLSPQPGRWPHPDCVWQNLDALALGDTPNSYFPNGLIPNPYAAPPHYTYFSCSAGLFLPVIIK